MTKEECEVSVDEEGQAEELSTEVLSEEESAELRRKAVVRGLEVYFRRHNLQALALAVFSLVASAVLWGLIYVFVFWFCLVGATLALSFNPATLTQITRTDLVSRWYPLYFALGAGISLAASWAVRKYVRPQRLREARFYFLWILVEVLLSVPNATLAVWGNFAAITRLRREDAGVAAQLLERMDAQEGAIRLSRLRVEIDDDVVRQRVLFALQLVGLVGVREREGGWFLCLEKREALKLLVESAAV